MLTNILEVSKVFLIPKITKFILNNFIPNLHFHHEKFLDNRYLRLIGDFLFYIVDSYNKFQNIEIEEKITEDDLFLIKNNVFLSVQRKDLLEISENYTNLVKQY